MKISIGKCIKELRNKAGRTQENLANTLGISAQAISRWEKGQGYPDMEMLPSIANYFHVSIDYLFGYDNEREERIENILFKADDAKSDEQLKEIIELLREAVKEFPAEKRIWLKYAHSLSLLTTKTEKVHIKEQEGNFVLYDYEKNANNTILKEAVYAYERVLDMDLSSDEHDSVVLNLCVYYAILGMYGKARELAMVQSSMLFCRENLLCLSTNAEQRDEHNAVYLFALLRMLKQAIMYSTGTKYSLRSSLDSIDAMLSVADLYKAIVKDENYGMLHSDLMDIYMNIAIIFKRTDNIENSQIYRNKAIYHKEEYEKVRNVEEFKYCTDIFSSLKYKGAELPEYTMLDFETWDKKLQFI